MSFSSEVKEELSKINIYKKTNIMEAEVLGYILSGNCETYDN